MKKQVKVSEAANIVDIAEAYGVAKTAAASWRVIGDPDPFDGRFSGDRLETSSGDMDDSVIKNGLHTAHRSLLSIGYLTSAKERIRWLSRRIFLSDDAAWIEQLEIERAQLPMGDVTDDVMANAVFMYGDDRDLALARKHVQAGCARIEWLSKVLTEKGLNHGQC